MYLSSLLMRKNRLLRIKLQIILILVLWALPINQAKNNNVNLNYTQKKRMNFMKKSAKISSGTNNTTSITIHQLKT